MKEGKERASRVLGIRFEIQNFGAISPLGLKLHCVYVMAIQGLGDLVGYLASSEAVRLLCREYVCLR